MTIGELIGTGFDYARRCRGLWLFGFLVSLASGGSNGGGNKSGGHHADGFGIAGLDAHLPHQLWVVAALTAVVLILVVAALILRFIAEGALIEGVARTRDGQKVTTRQGFGYGWAHFGVLFRLALTIGGVMLLSLIALSLPIALSFRFGGPPLGIAACALAALVGIPWLISVAMLRAFAARIAVLENRRAFDALRRARLFLHGRILLGLKMIVAAFAGSILIFLATAAVAVPIVLLLFALAIPLHMTVPAIALGGLIALPLIFVIGAVYGIMNSSIWTVGYLNEAAA